MESIETMDAMRMNDIVFRNDLGQALYRLLDLGFYIMWESHLKP
jgi:hypothetical protein